MVSFLPDATQTQDFLSQIQRTLFSSLSNIGDAAEEVVGFDGNTLCCKVSNLIESAYLQPAVFLLYYDCLDAFYHDQPDQLCVFLKEFLSIPVNRNSLTIRNLNDGSLQPQLWDRYHRALSSNYDEDFHITSCSSGLFNRASMIFFKAFSLISLVDKGLYDEIQILVREVIFVEDQPGSSKNFGGATSFQAWGAIFLNARRYLSVISMVEGLVHEAAHALLLASSSGRAMVENSPEELFSSPLRQEDRPMDGVFHATFVSARIKYIMDKIIISQDTSVHQKIEAEERGLLASQAFIAGYKVIKRFGRLTEEGTSAFAGATEYMSLTTRCNL